MYSDKQNASYFQYLQTNLNKESKAQLFPFTRLDPAQSYYCCQTGIADFIYKDKLSFSGYRYQELFVTVFYPAIQQLFSRFHTEGFSYLVGHTHKEIVIVFQPFTDTFSPLIFADEVDQRISRLSEEYLPLKYSHYCNVTALSIRLSVHLPKDETDLTVLCSASSYIIIVECYEAILLVLTRLCHAVQRTGAWSDAVAYAAYFLCANIGLDVSLPEFAAFADTTPAYLSNLFHQHTGMTIKQYRQLHS